ncbi:MAG TPA: hypothetical protein VIP07_01475 [Candidatus Limnocylindria bacterium]|jgi:plasmid stability protein
MGKLVQVRDVPDSVHRTLKARAAQSGSSLSEYLRGALTSIASQPTADEVRARLRTRPALSSRERPAAIIRRLREAGG